MSIFSVQRFIWIPLQRQHVIASLCAAGAMIFFGLSNFGGFPAFKSYAEITASERRLVLFNTLLFSANYLFLWRQAFPSYLRLRRSFLPVLASLVVLSTVAIALSAATSKSMTPVSSGAITAASSTKAPPPTATPNPQERGWLRLLLIAQGGLAVVILTAGLWKNDDETIASLARYLTEVRRLRSRFENGIGATDEAREARRALLFYLDAVIEWLKKNQYVTDLGPPSGRATALLKQCQDARQIAGDLDVGYFEKIDPQHGKLKFLDPITSFA